MGRKVTQIVDFSAFPLKALPFVLGRKWIRKRRV
jgi:hypothetical protein